jgi:hypothetical protein
MIYKKHKEQTNSSCMRKCCISCVGTMSSDSDSDENDDFDDEDDSSNSDDDTSSNEYNMRGPPLREISIVSVVDHSSVFAGGYENHAFSPDHEIANNRSRSSIINRKYDDITR